MQTLTNSSLQSYNSLGVDVTAQQVLVLQTYKDIVDFAKIKGTKTILGSGSNVLLMHDLHIVWINQYQYQPIVSQDHKSHYLQVGSGMIRDELVQRTIQHDLFGMENMWLIPGTVWAGLLGNIGAYGREISEFVESVSYLDLNTLKTHTISQEACQFEYRRSVFKTMKDYYITDVVFAFPIQEYKPSLQYPDIQKVIKEAHLDVTTIDAIQLYEIVCNIRISKMPPKDLYGTAGSFFKNPVVTPEKLQALLAMDQNIKYFPYKKNYKIAAWYLLDKLGYRWKIIWNVWCYKNQALILVNKWGSGKEIDQFAQRLEDHVLQVYGIQLEREVITL